MSNKPQISQINVDLHKLTTKENRTSVAARYVGKHVTSAFRFFSVIFVLSAPYGIHSIPRGRLWFNLSEGKRQILYSQTNS